MHIYECGECSARFKAGDEYPDEPQERTCLECKRGKGNILYLGYIGSLPFVQSDCLSFHGVKNPVDGKVYDSKSAYHRAVKDAGCVVVGNDAPTETKRDIRGDFDCKKELKEAFEKHFPTKRKKKCK